VPSHTRSKASAFTKKYLETLKKLSRKAKEFIIATDYDIEGEVIGWNVLRFIAGKETAKRMKYSTLTKTELEKLTVTQ
jgi:DNA topoisomerase-1